MSLLRAEPDFLTAGLRLAFAGFLGAAAAVGCEVAISMGLTLKYSVLPHPFAGPGSRATYHVISCTKYTIKFNQRDLRNERLGVSVVPSQPHFAVLTLPA